MKLQAGEYVSLGKVEAEMKTSPLVDNICVYAESSQQYCVALVIANEKALKAFATPLGVTGDFETLCNDDTIKTALVKELSAHGIKSRLERFEIPQKITLIVDSWSPANGLLTAAFKLKRNEIQKKYKAEIEKMYKS